MKRAKQDRGLQCETTAADSQDIRIAPNLSQSAGLGQPSIQIVCPATFRDQERAKNLLAFTPALSKLESKAPSIAAPMRGRTRNSVLKQTKLLNFFVPPAMEDGTGGNSSHRALPEDTQIAHTLDETVGLLEASPERAIRGQDLHWEVKKLSATKLNSAEKRSKRVNLKSFFKTTKELEAQAPITQILGWRNAITLKPKRHKPKLAIKVSNVFSAKFEDFIDDVNGVFFNVVWRKDSLETQLASLKSLQLSEGLMDNGILFMWSEKSILADILETMEAKGFKYIQNVVIAQLSLDTLNTKVKEEENLGKRQNLMTYFKQKVQVNRSICADAVSINIEKLEKKLLSLTSIDVDNLYHFHDSGYFRQTKQTLLMFRRNKLGKRLELRHQRNPDAFFDLHVPAASCGVDSKGMEKVYRIIETMLPKAKRNPEVPKLAEIGGARETARPGWITFYES